MKLKKLLTKKPQVVVTGIGLISCLGNLEQTWSRIINLQSGIRIEQPFKNIPPLPLGLIDSQPINLDVLTSLILKETLQDANLTPPLPDCGVVIGSSRGCQANWEWLIRQWAFGIWHLESNQQAKQMPNIQCPIPKIHWLDTLPSKPAQITARYLQSQSYVTAPMSACATGINAIIQGYQLIQQGLCSRVIVGGVEAAITPLTIAGFAQMGALAQTGCYPFDEKREGFVLGEGGAMLILESQELAISRNAKIYGQIFGWGMNCDAFHPSTPESTGYTAMSAIKQCLAQADLTPQDIDYIHAHGTATKLNDAREAKIIQHLFPHSVAVSSTKWATGHTLGASGAIATALSLMSIYQQQLLPNMGLTNSEFKLNLVRESLKNKLDNVLCFSFGFGGQNAILALGNV
jgi:3-oxoacyl-[acyl-carrier-protein] synthase II